MSAQRIPSIETSAELPVDALFSQSLEGFMEVHKELAKLPADPSDPLLPSDALLRNVGVDVDNDYSMFIMSAMGTTATNLGLEAMGLPTQGALAMGIDMASGILMGASEDRAQANAPAVAGQNKKGATSLYKGLDKKAHGSRMPQPKKAPAFCTSFMRRALLRTMAANVKNSAKKRALLKKQMQIHLDNLRDLSAFKSCGVTHAHKVTVPNGITGEKETYLVAAKDKPHMALTANGKSYQKPIDLSMMPGAAPSAPKLGFAA